MDTPKQPPNEPTKRTRVRLASPRKQLERTIQKMTKLSETTMKSEKLVDLLTWMGKLQLRLLDMDEDANKDALVEENERLKSELASRPTSNPLDDESKRMLERLDNEHLKKLTEEVETLKSQSATLRAQNAALSTEKNELRLENSEIMQKLQNLQLTNLELEVSIKTLQSRTTEELLAEIHAKNAMTEASLKSSSRSTNSDARSDPA